ncbi:hypothetical protein [Gaopeijia maritima]|uniref:Uncharacterized protein n=1 Tax=Gaopeijia maritima TaxID=3119007 RepID=A0ABU9EBZ8_9BACT
MFGPLDGHPGAAPSATRRLRAADDGIEALIVDASLGRSRRVHPPVTNVDVPAPYADSIWSVLLRAVGPGTPFSERDLREATEVPDAVPPMEVVAVTRDGSLWVGEPAFGAPMRLWRVLRSDDDEWESVSLPASLVVLDEAQGLIWARDEDALGVHYVVGLELSQPQPSR